MTSWRVRAALGLLLLAVSVGCTKDDPVAAKPAQVTVDWQQVQLPMPPGPPGRIAVRDAVVCDDRWFVVGGVFATPDRSRPAVWSSDDGVTWTSRSVRPRDYWARRSVLFSAACSEGQLAMIGGKSGGAHGNPRVSSWRERDDGVFVDVIAGYTLYGGAEATNVARVAAAEDGFLISGNRVSGAAVWTSRDAREFTLNDQDPALSNDETTRTLAIDQVHDGTQWTVVGSASVEGRLARVPMAWTSPDGQEWTRETVPGSEDFNDLERVVTVGSALFAVGLRGEGFGTWVRHGSGTWEMGSAFGRLDGAGGGSPAVTGLVGLPPDAEGQRSVLAAVSDGTRFRLWASSSSKEWAPVAVPIEPESGSERVLTVANREHDVLLLADDGSSGRVWLATW